MVFWIPLGTAAYFGIGIGISFLLYAVWKKGRQKGFLSRFLFPWTSRRETVGVWGLDEIYYLLNVLLWPAMATLNFGIHLHLFLWRFWSRDKFNAFWKKEREEAKMQDDLNCANKELDSCVRKIKLLIEREQFLKEQLQTLAGAKGDEQEQIMFAKARESFESELKDILKKKILLAPRIGVLMHQIERKEFPSLEEGVRVEAPEEGEAEYKKLQEQRQALRVKLQQVEHAISEHEGEMELAGGAPYRPEVSRIKLPRM